MTIQGNYRTSRIPRYYWPNHHRSASMFHGWIQVFRITGFIGRSPHTHTRPDVGNNHEGRSPDHITDFQSDVQVLRSSHNLFHILALLSAIRGLVIAALPWMLDLWNSRRTAFVETRPSRWQSSSVVTFAAVILWFWDTILFSVRWFLSLSFGFRRLLLSADEVFSWFVCAVITLDAAALDTANEVAVLVTDAPAKRSPTVCFLKFWQVSHFEVLSKKNHNDPIGNRTRDIPACSAVPQPTAFLDSRWAEKKIHISHILLDSDTFPKDLLSR